MHQLQTLSKKERLSSKKLTAKLFTRSQSFYEFPFKVVYFFADTADDLNPDLPVQVLFTVSKRFIKKAVHRNLTKRIMREAYRKNKIPLYEKLVQSEMNMVVGIIYNGHTPPDYHHAEPKIISVINRLIQEIDRNNKNNAPHSKTRNTLNTHNNKIN